VNIQTVLTLLRDSAPARWMLAAALASALTLTGYPLRASAQANEYKIRPYDQIQVTIAGASLLSQTVTV
jgi:protein involved in polysaccharide export with SLBB domain